VIPPVMPLRTFLDPSCLARVMQYTSEMGTPTKVLFIPDDKVIIDIRASRGDLQLKTEFEWIIMFPSKYKTLRS